MTVSELITALAKIERLGMGKATVRFDNDTNEAGEKLPIVGGGIQLHDRTNNVLFVNLTTFTLKDVGGF